MSVLPFSVARFTPADLVEFYRTVLPDCARGVWSGITRETSPSSDRLVLSDTSGDPAYTLERDAIGTYNLYKHDRNGVACIASAASISECLAEWRPRGFGARRRPGLAVIDTGGVPGW